MLGHQRVLDTLRAAIEKDNVGHAYIFEGAKGIGRRETALSFASMLMCRKASFPCGECKSCQLFFEGNNPDFQEIKQEDKSISVEDIRNVLKSLIIKPIYSKYKVIIINNADNMTVQAQNAILKSLEEPPPYIVFILTVKSIAAITQTVRSRCQRILFTKLSDETIKKILTDKFNEKSLNLDFIVSYSDGIIGTALDLAETTNLSGLRDEVLEAVDQLLFNKETDLFKIYELFEKNSDSTGYMLTVILLYLRDSLIYKLTTNFSLLINSDKQDMIIRNSQISASGLKKCIHTVWDVYRSLEYNANYELAIEVMLMKLVQINNSYC